MLNVRHLLPFTCTEYERSERMFAAAYGILAMLPRSGCRTGELELVLEATPRRIDKPAPALHGGVEDGPILHVHCTDSRASSNIVSRKWGALCRWVKELES